MEIEEIREIIETFKFDYGSAFFYINSIYQNNTFPNIAAWN